MEFVKTHKPVFLRHQPIAAAGQTHAWDGLVAGYHKFLLNMKGLVYAQLVVQCIVFLPLPILMILYYHVPVSIIATIFMAFVANIIACLDRPGARSINSIFAFCVIDMLMLLTFLI